MAMSKEERKHFLEDQELTSEEAAEIAEEFTDAAEECDLTVVCIFDNAIDLGSNYLDNVVGTLDHHVAAVLDVEALGNQIAASCDEYAVCKCSGRIVEFKL